MLIRKYRKKIKFGYSDAVFCCMVGLLIIGCIIWIYMTRFGKNAEKKITPAFQTQVEAQKEKSLIVYGDRRVTFGLKCYEQKSFVNGHDYLIFNPYYENSFKGTVVHDPDCKKCLERFVEEFEEYENN